MLFVTDPTYSENLTNEALKWFGDFKLGQVIRTVIHVDGIVLLAYCDNLTLTGVTRSKTMLSVV
jgi:hypothetical protein